jgi:hypothetical protein
MRTFETMRQALVAIAQKLAKPQRSSGFVCGECERWRSCGLPPSNNCIVMLEQVAREGRGSNRDGIIHYDAAWI